jgi:predicted nucleotidyltransferase
LKNLDLPKPLLKKIIDTILHHKPVDKIVLFGSRAQNRNHKASDIDIAVFSSEWTSTDINIVHNKLEENILTVLQFDVVHFNSLQNEFLKKEIEKGVTLYHA